MNCCDAAVCKRIKTLLGESENYINLLYESPCIYTRSLLLSQLSTKMTEIDFLNSLIYQQMKQIPVGPAELSSQRNKSDFTLQELAKFNGKDGNPAYVAVNGMIYDVTDNAAWAAASHFGLTAGKDLTSEFTSCHAGQSILNKLKVVGKLIK